MKMWSYKTPSAESKNFVQKYPAIDGLKGILIFFIIITHCLPECTALYFLYLFHMPLFLGISGFLLKQSAFKSGLRSYLKRLFNRVGIPWLIAFAVYLPFQLGSRAITEFSIADVLYPFYHLWYIPAYVIGAIACYFIRRWKLPIVPIMILTGSITAIWYIVYRDSPVPVEKQIFYWGGDKRFLGYLFFFITGYAVRNKLLQLKTSALVLSSFIIISLFVLLVCVKADLPDVAVAGIYMLFNFSLLLLLLQHIASMNLLQQPLLITMNKQSLGIYLYHPLIILVIFWILNDPSKLHTTKLLGVAIGLLTLAVVLGLVWFMKKSKLSNTYMLGNVRNALVVKKPEPASAKSIAA